MPPPRPPCCPRCGYDQSGVAASWTESCPLTGVCSECGLTLAWRDVLNPRYNRDSNALEVAHKLRARTVLRTAWLTLRPRRLWELITLYEPVRGWRLAMLVMFAVVLMHATLVVMFLVHLQTPSVVYWLRYGRASWGNGNIFAPVTSPLSMLWPYRLTWDYQWDYSWEYGDPNGMPGAASWLVLGTLAVCALIPRMFVLLPQTIRRAKVKREHLWRVTAYLAVPMAVYWSAYWVVLFLALTTAGWTGLHTEFGNRMLRLTLGSFTPGIGVFLIALWWWRVAARRYLRLEHPGGVALAVCVLAGLVVVLVGLLSVYLVNPLLLA